MPAVRFLRRSLPGLLVAALACGDDGGNATATGPGSFAFAISPTTISVAQAQSGTITVSLTRRAPFTAPVTITVESATEGISTTLSAGTIAPSSSSTTLTVAVGAAVAPGDYPVTIRAAADGFTEQATTTTVTVTAAATSQRDMRPAIDVAHAPWLGRDVARSAS